MKKLLAILFHSLPNAAHFNYVSRVRDVLAAAGTTVKTALGALITEFNHWHDKEFALIEWVRRNTLTAKIAEADHRLDQALVALKAQVHALEYSPTTDIAEAARHLNNMLQSYGKVYKKPYDEQVGDVLAIVAHLNNDYSADVATLGVAAQCVALYAAYTDFRTLFEQRGTESLQKPAESFVAVRRGIDKVYHQIAFKLNAGAAMGADGFDAVIDQLNPDVAHMNDQFHRARKDLGVGDHTVIEPIETQQYTERPITVVPEVHYREEGKETKRLYLGEDFTVTYKNNVKVGMAELTIHGKGEYRGSRTTTFNIAR